MTATLKFSPLVFEIQDILSATSGIYLVGGAVRDALLGKPSRDLDFAVEGDALRTARKLADHLGGSYYCMDAEFQVGRVVLGSPEDRSILDFSIMHGENLEADLRQRDFTVNAMAVDLQDLEKVIDPLGGGVDLLKGRLTMCTPQAFTTDPVRVLRALRMAASFNLALQPDTKTALKAAVNLLPNVSMERQRDELFKILDAPNPSANLRVIEVLGILDYILPECAALKGLEQSSKHLFDAWGHTLHVVERLEDILRLLDKQYVHDNESGGDLFSGVLSLRLGRYREQISAHFSQQLNQERSMHALLLLAGLYHDITKPQHRLIDEDGEIRFFGHDETGAEVVKQRASRLRLSSAEGERLAAVVRGHMRPWQLTKTGEAPTRKAVYRFWREAGPAGVEVCLLSIADLMGVYGHTLPQEMLERHIETVRALLEAYWERPEEVSPAPLLDGNDLIKQFGVAPGPQIGELLDALGEAQAAGEVGNKKQALAFVRRRIEG